MIKSIIKLDEETNRVINIVKAKYGLRDKSQAVNLIVKRFEEFALEPELRPEFVRELKKTMKRGKVVKVKDFDKEFGLKKKSQ